MDGDAGNTDWRGPKGYDFLHDLRDSRNYRTLHRRSVQDCDVHEGGSNGDSRQMDNFSEAHRVNLRTELPSNMHLSNQTSRVSQPVQNVNGDWCMQGNRVNMSPRWRAQPIQRPQNGQHGYGHTSKNPGSNNPPA